jgi:hypothetical protein
LREYEIETTNVDEYSANFKIHPSIWKSYLADNAAHGNYQALIVGFEVHIKKLISARLEVLINKYSNELAAKSLKIDKQYDAEDYTQ